MKIIKILKYKLTEDTLEKDIDSFILEARKGKFSWDYKYGNEGLKIIKAYFRMIQEKFEKEEYEECKVCYGKLILFLFDASRGDDKANFDYEDLLSRVSNNFDKYIKNYFICLIKTCNIEDLSERVLEYVMKLKEYGFESDIKILTEDLGEQSLKNLEEIMLIKTEGITKSDRNKIGIIHFLMEIAHRQKNKEKYLKLCERLRGIIPEKELNYIVWEFDEQGPEPNIF